MTANSGFGCPATSADLVVKAGYGNSSIDISPAPTPTTGRPAVCGNSTLSYSLHEDQAIGGSTDLVWTATNCTILTDQSGGDAKYIQVQAPSSGTFSISLRYLDGCGTYRVPGYTNPAYNNSIQAQYSINGQPCSVGPMPRPAAFPNPANTCVTLENIRGTVQLYNAQGNVQRQQQATAGAATLDTRNLPNGLYYLIGDGLDGRPSRQTVQIWH